MTEIPREDASITAAEECKSTLNLPNYISVRARVGDHITLNSRSAVDGKVRPIKVRAGCVLGSKTHLKANVYLHHIIGRCVHIGEGVKIGANCVIGAGVSIETGAVIQSEVHIGDRTRISKDSWVLNGAKLCRKVLIKECATVRQDARIGDRTCITKDADVLRGVQIGRGATLEEGEVVKKHIPDVHGAH